MHLAIHSTNLLGFKTNERALVFEYKYEVISA